MSSPTKAVLLSGLIFPGAGHLYLKSYPKAISLVLLVVICLGFYIAEAIKQSQTVISQIDASNTPLSEEEITALIYKSVENTDTTMIAAVSFTLIGCWVFGVIDSYRLGKKSNHG
ncbi:hypothetical protein [Oceanicoccus sagamiensis]|uniref:DUF5683 domain-containing protein n=1 Tax=Oceanicoccus sagamiensis TaxID=716816 RepID=A0A1X9NFA7_9GAMM|nr:hypothetical protein [Oceanicoccus sagamiensis]ARN73637.1 hypothetical protein BST96_05595 [Oceanicoccus sagamiensis]